jgi:hypothetical protein
MNSKTIARGLALCALVGALLLTVTVKRSHANADEWDLNVTFGAFNTSLFVLALLIYWASSRFSKTSRSDSDQTNKQ